MGQRCLVYLLFALARFCIVVLLIVQLVTFTLIGAHPLLEYLRWPAPTAHAQPGPCFHRRHHIHVFRRGGRFPQWDRIFHQCRCDRELCRRGHLTLQIRIPIWTRRVFREWRRRPGHLTTGQPLLHLLKFALCHS